MYAIATSLLALSWLCGHVIGSPVATDASSEGKLFVPSLEEHEVHLKAMMEDAYTPEALARDSENNPQFTSDYPFDESEMEFLGEEKGYDDDEDDDDYFLDDEDDSFNGTALEARQAPCGQWSGTTRPASPKSPRHDFFHKQLTVRPCVDPSITFVRPTLTFRRPPSSVAMAAAAVLLARAPKHSALASMPRSHP